MAYNPFWNQYDTREFCDDLIPCMDDTHNVGSTDQRWKDGFFSGTVQANSFAAVSDVRMKQEITTLPSPLETIRNIRGVTYQWKHNKNQASGVVAQEVERAAPECTVRGEDGMLRVDYNALVGYCIESIRKLDRTINGRDHNSDPNLSVEEDSTSQEQNKTRKIGVVETRENHLHPATPETDNL